MKLITKSPTNSTNNIHESYFNNRIKKNPYVNSELSLDKYEIINKSCNCSCHKHKHHHRFHQHILNNNLSINKFGKLEISQIMDNNKKVDENRNIQKNKSMNNLSTNPNIDYYTFKECENEYSANYNNNIQKNNINKNRANNYRYKDITTSKNNLYNNHSFVEVKDTSKSKKYTNKTYKVNIPRKELSKFYHYVGLRRYSYGKGKVETTNNSKNHKYTEIYENSGVNNNNKMIIINKNDNVDNHRYSYYKYSPKNSEPNFEIEEQKDSQIQTRIIKETDNTRLLEVKSPGKEQKNYYNKNLYCSGNRKNLFNNYTYNARINSNYNNMNYNNNNNNYRCKIIRNLYNNNYNDKNNNNYSYIEKKEIKENNLKVSNIKPNDKPTKFLTKYNHTPHCLFYRNANLALKNQSHTNIEDGNDLNDMSIRKKLCMLRNHRINNLNYNILRQKVRLSLLKKQIYNHKRNMLLNNKKNNYDNALYEKTKKIMDNDNYLENSNKKNNIDYEGKRKNNYVMDYNYNEQ